MGKKVFVVDMAICNGCYTCQFACKDEHAGNDWSPIAKPQPEIGQFWLKLDEQVRGSVPKVKVTYRPHLCMHCDKAPCMESCPVRGAIYKRDDGLVIVDPTKCTGCRSCVDACPHSTIYFNEDTNIAQKCTGCAHLLDNGWTEPRCADACPTLALRFMDEEEAEEIIKGADVWRPELKDKTRPRVYYLNVPGKFIAGTVFDPAEDEVVIGADCTLTESGGKAQTVFTDNYGDFRFNDLKDGRYSLAIKNKDKIKTFDKLDTGEADINLGDIPLV
ncbi:MAG: 4Fe-4S dicluster domain-containing protein [Clostridiales Family XIII bacterium]|jgi:Fe-S-cluster-containing dehydrogenase component|nr:4Fe-4S dicluster domain-containing protein [Clostridiales Family XIII bacterium]